MSSSGKRGSVSGRGLALRVFVRHDLYRKAPVSDEHFRCTLAGGIIRVAA
jgi:hypothetical protein